MEFIVFSSRILLKFYTDYRKKKKNLYVGNCLVRKMYCAVIMYVICLTKEANKRKDRNRFSNEIDGMNGKDEIETTSQQET